MATPAGTVKVLHRATDEDSPTTSGGGGGPGKPELQAEVDSLKQRLEQTKASAAAERKRLADDLRLERAGRERAEQLLVKQTKELESITAAKGRLEEAFSRSMSELRLTRLEYAQAEDTIQQLLRELMLLREILTKSAALAPHSPRLAAGGGGGSGDGSAEGGVSAASISNKRISRSKLLGELQAMRAAKADAESKRDSLLAQLGALEAEKERAEESQEMISRETAKLLDDKRQLLRDLGAKDEAVRGLEAGLDHLHHQLELALADRHLLLDQLSKVADPGELDALQAAMDGADEPGGQQRVSDDGAGEAQQRQQQQQQEQQRHGSSQPIAA